MTEQASIIAALLCCPHTFCDGAVKVHVEEPEDRLAQAAAIAANPHVSLFESRRRLRHYLKLRRMYR